MEYNYIFRRGVLTVNLQLKLQELYFGETDGEVEATKDNFEELFCNEGSKYSEIMSSHMKFMIIGRKGAGKTYLAKYMCKNHPNPKLCKWINSEDFNIQKLSFLSEDSSDPEYNIARVKWYLLKNIAELMINEHPTSCKYNIFYKKYRLYKLYNKIENNKLLKIIKTVNEQTIGGRLLNKNGFEIKKDKTVKYELLPKEFFEVLDTLQKLIIKSVSKKDNILLILDDLDCLDKKLSSSSAGNNYILHFINIAKELNSIFSTSKLKIKIVLLLRTDILNKLQSLDGNLSKTVTSCSVNLYWLKKDIGKPENHPLMKMILHKVRATGKIPGNITDKELYYHLFPEKIADKSALEYLLDYSQGRPRDIILYLNHVKLLCPNASYFSATAIKEAVINYSSDFYDSIINEATYYHDNTFIEDSIKLISGLKRHSFTLQNVKDYYTANKKYFHGNRNLYSILTFLYDLGVIGNCWEDEDYKHFCSWSYRIDSIDQIDFSKKFLLHYGVRKKFSM